MRDIADMCVQLNFSFTQIIAFVQLYLLDNTSLYMSKMLELRERQ